METIFEFKKMTICYLIQIIPSLINILIKIFFEGELFGAKFEKSKFYFGEVLFLALM